MYKKTPGLLEHHIMTRHNPSEHERDMFTCSSCGKQYKDRKQVIGHRLAMGKLHDTKCRICPDFEARGWTDNLRHFNEVHGGEIQYKCGLCPRWFQTIVQARNHSSANGDCTGEKNRYRRSLTQTIVW